MDRFLTSFGLGTNLEADKFLGLVTIPVGLGPMLPGSEGTVMKMGEQSRLASITTYLIDD